MSNELAVCVGDVLVVDRETALGVLSTGETASIVCRGEGLVVLETRLTGHLADLDGFAIIVSGGDRTGFVYLHEVESRTKSRDSRSGLRVIDETAILLPHTDGLGDTVDIAGHRNAYLTTIIKASIDMLHRGAVRFRSELLRAVSLEPRRLARLAKMTLVEMARLGHAMSSDPRLRGLREYVLFVLEARKTHWPLEPGMKEFMHDMLAEMISTGIGNHAGRWSVPMVGLLFYVPAMTTAALCNSPLLVVAATAVFMCSVITVVVLDLMSFVWMRQFLDSQKSF